MKRKLCSNPKTRSGGNVAHVFHIVTWQVVLKPVKCYVGFLSLNWGPFIITFLKINFGNIICFCYNFFNKEIFKKSFKWKMCLDSLS